jgi:hypothetical protein
MSGTCMQAAVFVRSYRFDHSTLMLPQNIPFTSFLHTFLNCQLLLDVLFINQ